MLSCPHQAWSCSQFTNLWLPVSSGAYQCVNWLITGKFMSWPCFPQMHWIMDCDKIYQMWCKYCSVGSVSHLSSHLWMIGWCLAWLTSKQSGTKPNSVAKIWLPNLVSYNTLRPKQNGRNFADDNFKCIFFNENASIPINISLMFVPQGPINNIPALI